jgi:FKBP-type peptidyl-prolyl cis-trans isomerase
MLGVEIAGQMGDLPKDIKDTNEIKAFIAGIEAQFSGSVDRSVVNVANGQALAELLAGRRAARVGPADKEAAEQDKEATARSNAKLMVGTEMKEGVKRLPSGLLIETLVEGTGAAPSASSTVTVHYTGMLADGSVFDSSVERGEPASFAVAQVVKGFAEGILNMKVCGP